MTSGMMSSTTDEWPTPRYVYDKLDEEFGFELDVCATDDNHKADRYFTKETDGLCEYLIRTYTDEGMTVLDNCMGSGTTGVAAIQTGRNFIGIEKDPDYYKMAVDRIKDAEYKVQSRTTLEDFA